MKEAKYSIGIDLGTTHCAVSCVDLAQSQGETVAQATIGIPQLTSPGNVEEKVLLPSFLYLPHPDEFAQNDLMLPWDSERQYVVGELARSQGMRTPIRVVSSAKSWLCHPGVDRRSALLPLDAPDEIEKISPLQASIHYLQDLHDAWNNQHPDAPLAQQSVTITVPASFDPAARDLTAEAARAIGLDQFLLLEEPQAALYSWLQATGGNWRKQVKPGDIILVIDVGGGTTDLSLIAVTEQEGNLVLQRIAVGDHILLGGDNMDLALAHVVSSKLANQGTRLEPWQLHGLTHACRTAKEILLNDPNAETVPVVVPSRSSRLIGGTLRTELTRAEVMQTIVEGFFPKVEVMAQLVSRPRGALTKLGLPYAQDAAITRHLAAFLTRQVGAAAELTGFENALAEGASFLHPTAVLFNGGVFKAPLLTERVSEVINSWLQKENSPTIRLLEGADLDLAVAKGAAYYGYVRLGQGVRIRGGTAKSYYIGVESAMPAVPGVEPPIQILCVAPFGMEEGTRTEVPSQEFGLVVGEPVRFRFFGSSVRREDEAGMMLDEWLPEEIEELEEIEINLPAENHSPGEVVPVHLQAAITEMGTLHLEAVSPNGEHWKVEFDVRGGVENKP
ncbi:Hsp70 family protein [Nitrosomonas communis]|uniref:Molecular chaperone DnaK (HSP70) n=1 Tax=Nitrosomonas communis TaxID=44574 RepID=A0A1I4M2D4_9PROT|nr:Hsp70 family protein [Nitrosomonas communis]SFL97364.1 Molecular chaperone DnaK (HSP70) [Nitrosomonas communis]